MKPSKLPGSTDPVFRNCTILLFFVAAATSWSATYDASAAFETGFTSQSNPNGVWSYGYSSGFTAPVTLYNLTSQPGVHGPNAQYWSSSSSITATSSVQFNNGPLYNDGNVDISANGLTLVWFGSQYSDLVFTAPAAGTYSVTGAFLGSQHNVGSTVAVVANGAVVFNSTVTSEGQVVPLNAPVTLAAGSTVVFSAGPGGGTQNTGLVATVTGPLPPAAVTYDPSASFETGFTSHSNPNGVWSYGYSSGFTGPVTLYNLTSQPGVHGPNAQYWSSSSSITATSSVQFNNGPLYNDGNVDISANGLTLVWFGSQYSDLVFTAPAAGAYAVTGAFLGSQNNVGSTVAVVANGAAVFNSSVTSEGQVVPFDNSITLAAGSTVVFSAGPGGGTQNTGLLATVTGPVSPASATPAITLVQNAEGGASTIAPNTWVTLKGSNLAPAGDSRIWQASDFVNNQLPTQLDGVSVTLNGEKAFVYYISPTQINILTPPDLAAGTVQVQAATSAGTSASFAAQAQAESPSFFIFGAGPYVAATHGNGSLLGPASLYPGQTTPANPGETIVLYANGFGPTQTPVVSGSETQSGSLNPLPVVTIGKNPATVQFAGLISPGLYQFNVVVPASTPAGDNALTATYAGQTTQSGVLVTVGP